MIAVTSVGEYETGLLKAKCAPAKTDKRNHTKFLLYTNAKN